MEKRAVLGRGLSALIPENVETGDRPRQEEGAKVVKTELIGLNQQQPRLHYEEDKLEELKASIREKGILQPILVRRVDQGYEVVAGERRLRAAKAVGLKEVPVVIRDVDDNEALVLALVENIQRENLNPIEEARAFRRLVDDFRLTQEQVADAVGKERSTVSNMLRLLKLPAEMQEAVSKGLISMGHARALLSVENAQKQYQMFVKFLEGEVNVRQAEQLSKADRPVKRPRKDKDHEVARLEEELSRLLGTKVLIEARQKRGRVVIEYYSLDDLDRILEIIRR